MLLATRQQQQPHNAGTSPPFRKTDRRETLRAH